MEEKHISITICDDCMNMDVFEDSRIIHRRHCLYFVSSLISSLFLVGLFYWTWVVIRDIDNE